jgi:hypothetical protein
MPKKSKAQTQRMIQRAAARGEIYQPPQQHDNDDDANAATMPPLEQIGENNNEESKKKKKLLHAAQALIHDVQAIDTDTALKAKDRRSAKRKAEAMAQEYSGITADELLRWYKKECGTHNKNNSQGAGEEKRQRNPYIVFFGQLSFDTTKESLFQHIRDEMHKEHKITPETVHIRLLTDAKTKKSRGMAFVELSDPETMYSCLKLHHTMLDGRRMNVERSAGGVSDILAVSVWVLSKGQGWRFGL